MKWLVITFLAGICLVSAETSVDAVDLSYSCVRPQTARNDLSPILLMHGMLTSKENWKGIYEVLALQTNRTVCMSDARNHGHSPRTEDFSFDLMASDTVRLLDRLNVSKAILLGHSMGGKTAVVTALKYPNRVDKLLVEDMRPNSNAPGVLFRLAFTFNTLKLSLDAVPEGATEQQAREAVINFIRSTLKTLNADLDEKMETLLESILVCNNSKCHFLIDIDFALKMIDNPSLRKVYEGLYDGEALFIYGETSDFRVWEAEEEIKNLFPKAELVGIEGAGHMVHEEKPREFLTAAIRFINGNESENKISTE